MKEDNKRKICNKVGLSSTLEQIVFECMEQYANERLEAERSNIETLLHKILKESVGGNVPFSFELYNEIKAALKL